MIPHSIFPHPQFHKKKERMNDDDKKENQLKNPELILPRLELRGFP